MGRYQTNHGPRRTRYADERIDLRGRERDQPMSILHRFAYHLGAKKRDDRCDVPGIDRGRQYGERNQQNGYRLSGGDRRAVQEQWPSSPVATATMLACFELFSV